MSLDMRAAEQRLLADPTIRQLIVSFNEMNLDRERKAALAEPAKHKLSRIMDNTAYRFWDGGKNGKGQTVRFCYSSHRNVAGYFLGWREIVRKETTKRDQWCARKTRAAVTDIARQRYNKFIAVDRA